MACTALAFSFTRPRLLEFHSGALTETIGGNVSGLVQNVLKLSAVRLTRLACPTPGSKDQT